MHRSAFPHQIWPIWSSPWWKSGDFLIFRMFSTINPHRGFSTFPHTVENAEKRCMSFIYQQFFSSPFPLSPVWKRMVLHFSTILLFHCPLFPSLSTWINVEKVENPCIYPNLSFSHCGKLLQAPFRSQSWHSISPQISVKWMRRKGSVMGISEKDYQELWNSTLQIIKDSNTYDDAIFNTYIKPTRLLSFERRI